MDADVIDLTNATTDGDQFVAGLFVFLRWLLRLETRIGDVAVARCAGVCKAWRRVCRDRSLFAGLMRVVSFDVGMRNLAMWAGSYDPARPEIPFVFHHWELIDLCTTVPSEAIFNFARFMTEHGGWLHLGYERVLIENQPRLEASQMQSIGACLQTYFTTRRLTCDVYGGDETRDYVQLVHAGNKLKVYKGELPKPINKPASRSAQYNYRKRLAEAHAIEELRIGEEHGASPMWRDYFLSRPKKDDLADAFLQAAHYLETTHGPKVPRTRKRKATNAEDDAPPAKRKRAAPKTAGCKRKNDADDTPAPKKRAPAKRKRKTEDDDEGKRRKRT